VLHFAGDGSQLATLAAPNGRLASTVGLRADQLDRDDITAECPAGKLGKVAVRIED
jgi:hypothetical protein